jgi:hypothetical protein
MNIPPITILGYSLSIITYKSLPTDSEKYKVEIQNYWIFGRFPSSGILENKKHDFWETGCFHSQVKVEKTSAQLGPLEGANLNHWITLVRFTQLFNHLRPS